LDEALLVVVGVAVVVEVGRLASDLIDTVDEAEDVAFFVDVVVSELW
jgi:hypothetical protein